MSPSSTCILSQKLPTQRAHEATAGFPDTATLGPNRDCMQNKAFAWHLSGRQEAGILLQRSHDCGLLGIEALHILTLGLEPRRPARLSKMLTQILWLRNSRATAWGILPQLSNPSNRSSQKSQGCNQAVPARLLAEELPMSVFTSCSTCASRKTGLLYRNLIQITIMWIYCK